MIQTVVKQDEGNTAIQCCIECKNCINTDLAYCCACAFKTDFVTGKRVYCPCERARLLINGDSNLDCKFFKKNEKRLKSWYCKFKNWLHETGSDGMTNLDGTCMVLFLTIVLPAALGLILSAIFCLLFIF